MKQTLMLDLFEDGKKVAEEDITRYTVKQLADLLLIQIEFYNRTWEYRPVFKTEEKTNNFIPLSETAERVEKGER